MEKLKPLVAEINNAIAAFQDETNKLLEKGNKAAGQRARVLTSKTLQPLFKEFRKVSKAAK